MPRKSASKRPAQKKTGTKSPRRPSKGRPSKGRSAKARAGKATPQTQRLQRLLASAGFGSRRQCEELIEAGRVHVDGAVVTKLGTTVDPDVNKVIVDGVLLKKQKLVYYAVNKPIGFVTTNRDPQGRPRVVDLVPPDERVFPVGRLDRNSEGLILLTNDGDLAQKLTHPKFGVRKVYRVTVAGKVDTETMKQMRKGIYIAEGFVKVEGAKLLKSRSRSTEMEIVLREGKNREIRRILARLGHKVQHLRRIAVGPLRLGDVPPGAYRVVSHQEVEKLWQATETSTDSAPRKIGRKKSGGHHAAKKSNRRPTKGPGKKAAGKKATAKRGAKRESTASSEFHFEESHTVGSVIGADGPAVADERAGKKAGRRKATATDRSKGGRKKSKAATGKRGGTNPGKKRGTKRKPPKRKRKG